MKRNLMNLFAVMAMTAGLVGNASHSLFGQDIQEVYYIAPGDRVSILKVGEFEKVHLVPFDGRIPLGTNVFCSILGLTLTQAGAEASRVYEKETGSPAQFVFSLMERNSEDVSVTGNVQAPGPQPSGKLSMIMARAKWQGEDPGAKIIVRYPDDYKPPESNWNPDDKKPAERIGTVIYKWKNIVRKPGDLRPARDPYIPKGSLVYVVNSKWYRVKQGFLAVLQTTVMIAAIVAVVA